MTALVGRAGLFAAAATLTLACAHQPETAPLTPAVLTYFQDSYAESRAAFRELAVELQRRHQGTEITVLGVPSEVERDLTIDLLYAPAAGPGRLLVLSSGVHGVEGFVGSAMQQLFLVEQIDSYLARGISVLLIHSVNPYGFSQLRRVSENNVDLNRTFDTGDELFKTKNEGYVEVSGLLNPTSKVSMFGEDQVFLLKAIFNIALKGMANLRQAVLQGQYEEEHGLYFGGRSAEPQRHLLEPMLLERFAQHEKILMIDLHSGYGERGKLHLFPTQVADEERRADIERLFKGYRIDFGDSDDFYTVTGDFTGYVGKLMPESKLFVPMTFEFGTLDSQTTMGSIRSIHNMILENQGFHHGYESEADRVEVKRRFREMYYPSSPRWRRAVVLQSQELFGVVAERFAAW